MGQGLLAVSPQSRYPTTGSIICFCGLYAYVEVAIDAGLTDAHVAEARLARPCRRPGLQGSRFPEAGPATKVLALDCRSICLASVLGSKVYRYVEKLK